MAGRAERSLRSTPWRALALWALLVPLLVAAEVEEFYAGLEAYDAGEHAKAFEIWLPLAEAGYPASQANIGLLYWRGLGVEADSERAAHWLQTAAEAENAAAADNLGQMYLDGDGVAQDDEAAAHWIRRAARLGNANAQSRVGMLYSTGRGIDRDPVAAVKWWTRAAEQDHVGATVRLGRAYALGAGVEKDIDAARVWLERAAALGSEEASADLAHLASAEGADAAVVAEASEPEAATTRVVANASRAETAGGGESSRARADESGAGAAPVAPEPVGALAQRGETRAGPEPGSAASGGTPPRPAPEPGPIAAAPPTPEPAPKPAARIQLVALRKRERAEVARGQLEAKHRDLLDGLELFIERADLGERGTFYRVRAGHLASVDAARALCARMQERRQSCIVVAD